MEDNEKLTYQGTGRIISSPASAKLITVATNAMLQPAVKATSSTDISAFFPYTSFISPARAVLSEISPAAGQYPHDEGDLDAFESPSRRLWGGAMPGTPCDMSSKGRVGDGMKDPAHLYALGMLCVC